MLILPCGTQMSDDLEQRARAADSALDESALCAILQNLSKTQATHSAALDEGFPGLVEAVDFRFSQRPVFAQP